MKTRESILEGIAIQAASSDIGLSSAAIVSRYLDGRESKRKSYPRDSSDFGRCYHLIMETGIDIKIMSGVSKEWDSIVFSWDRLVAAYNDGIPLSTMIRRILS